MLDNFLEIIKVYPGFKKIDFNFRAILGLWKSWADNTVILTPPSTSIHTHTVSPLLGVCYSCWGSTAVLMTKVNSLHQSSLFVLQFWEMRVM